MSIMSFPCTVAVPPSSASCNAICRTGSLCPMRERASASVPDQIVSAEAGALGTLRRRIHILLLWAERRTTWSSAKCSGDGDYAAALRDEGVLPVLDSPGQESRKCYPIL